MDYLIELCSFSPSLKTILRKQMKLRIIKKPSVLEESSVKALDALLEDLQSLPSAHLKNL